MRSLIFSIAIIAVPCTMPMHFVAAPSTAEAALLGGTIVSINQDALTLTLTILLPTGESRALPVREARLLHGLSVGDHVTFELNDEHTLIKIAKLPTDPAN